MAKPFFLFFFLRTPTSLSDGSTVVMEEPQTISQGLEDELSEMKKKLNDNTERYAALQKRIHDLENENEEKTAQMKLVEEASLKEKADLMRAHTAELENHRRQVLQLQQSLEANQRQAKKIEEELAREKEVLGQEIVKRDELLRDSQTQIHDLGVAKGELRDAVRKLEVSIEEKDELVEDLHGRNLAAEEMRQVLEKEVSEMKAEIVRTKDANQKNLDQLTGDHHRKLTDATTTIQGLRHELSSHVVTIDQLRASLDASHVKTDEVSKVAEERAKEVQRLQQLLSGLQETNQALEQKVEDQESQIQIIKQTSDEERANLCATHTLEMDAQHRTVQNLQSSLESMQQDLRMRDEGMAKLTRENGDLRDELERLGDQCRKGEERAKGLEDDLTEAKAVIRDLEERLRTTQEEAKTEKVALMSKVDRLHQQLDDTQKLLTERDERIQRLEASKGELENALRRVQTAVNEKELVIQDLQHRYATLEEAKKDLDGRVVEMERALVEAKDEAREALQKAVEDHQREMGQAKGRIQELQDKLSSSITTSQQLHASLEASRADTEKVEKIAEERREEISLLQQRTSGLQENIRTLEAKAAESMTTIQSMEQAAREEKAGLLRTHAAEMETQRQKAHGVQETLERDLKESREKLKALFDENGVLREEVATMKERNRKNEEDIRLANATLSDVTERSKISVEKLEDEKAKLDDEVQRLRCQAEELEKDLKARSEEVEKLKKTPLQTLVSNVLGVFWNLSGASSSAASRSG